MTTAIRLNSGWLFFITKTGKKNIMNIRLTKEFNFEAAHALHNYDGKCKYLHGHSYKLLVTIIGEPLADENNPKFGMVMDFGDLKKIVNTLIINKYDHATILSNKSTIPGNISNAEYMQNVLITSFQPTCENMLIHFATEIKNKLPKNIKLHALKLYETETSFGEWYAADNEK